MKIAIIEDDKITRLELSKLLNSHGYETVLLTDSIGYKKALIKHNLRTTKYDLVMLRIKKNILSI